MKKNLLTLIVMTTLLGLYSCGGGAKTSETEANIDDDAFYSTQPIRSGLYDADYFDITGPNAKRGRFDGRIYFSLSPKTSGLYVFENGNRTKIDYIVGLEKPFEKGDSGIYCTTDMKGKPVSINTDSTAYTLKFIHFNDTIKVLFNPKPRHTGTAIDILEKMNAQKNKK